MRDSRSISEAGRTSGISFADVRSSAMDRASRILIVSDWPSTNFRRRSICARMPMPEILPLGGALFAGILPGRGRETGEQTVKAGKSSELKGRC